LLAFTVAFAALLGAGCAGYKLGPTNGMAAGGRSIQVNPFQNQTLEPRLTDPVTSQVRKQLQQDGTYTLDTHNEGDLIVTGTLLEYRRFYLAFDPRDVVTPREFRVQINARIVVRERSTGRVVLDRNVIGHSEVRSNENLPNVERQAVPLIAADLARNITSAIVDGKW
jgi:hypothetical protein